MIPSKAFNSIHYKTTGVEVIASQCEFLVLADICGEHTQWKPLRLGQQSLDGTDSLSGSTVAVESQNSEVDARNILQLVCWAMRWLLQQNSKTMDQFGVTPSIYWAVRNLPSFYAQQIALAATSGARALSEIEEAD